MLHVCAVVKKLLVDYQATPGSNLIVFVWHLGPVVHKYHISVQLSFKTFKFGCIHVPY